MEYRHKIPALLLHSFLPLLTGGIIYLLYRPDTLLLFRWIHGSYFSDMVFIARGYRVDLPAWVIYSLPDALWTYSMVSFYLALWNGIITGWLIAGICIGILPEIMQLPGWVPGTFDMTDVLLKAVFIALAFLHVIKTKQIYEKDA